MLAGTQFGMGWLDITAAQYAVYKWLGCESQQ